MNLSTPLVEKNISCQEKLECQKQVFAASFILLLMHNNWTGGFKLAVSYLCFEVT